MINPIQSPSMQYRGVKVARSEKELENLLTSGEKYVIIYDSKTPPLYRSLEVLSRRLKKVDSAEKYFWKIAEEVQFSEGAVLEVNSESYDVYSLSEALDKVFKLGISPYELTPNSVTLLVKSSDEKEVANTIQQLILLGLRWNVSTPSEVATKKALKVFESQKEEVIEAAEESFKYAQNFNLEANPELIGASSQLKKIVGELVTTTRDNFKAIIENLRKLELRNIKVAVFATKKSGKSMVVNALLGEEFAPTSAELPTPNVIEYIPHDGGLKLEYGGRTLHFSTKEELWDYIHMEFERVKDRGEGLPTMRVYYPRKPGINFEIYDTPGPDLAGAEDHKRIAEEYLNKADVAVFVVDYSKHAQESEVELLERLKEVFKQKMHSLICAINKLDLMFDDTSTEKIISRVALFIRHVLERSGLEGVVAIPISAMTYFYTVEFKKKFPEAVNNPEWKEFLRPKVYKDKIDRAVARFIQNQINTFEYIFEVDPDEIRFEDIVALSNFEPFKNHLIYVAQDKAYIEKAYSTFATVDTRQKLVQNTCKSGLLLISDETEKIRQASTKFLNYTSSLLSEERFRRIVESLEEVKEEVVHISVITTQKSIQAIASENLIAASDYFRKLTERLINELTEISQKGWLDKIFTSIEDELERLKSQFSHLTIFKGDFLIDGIEALLREEFRGILREDLEKKIEEYEKRLEKEMENLKSEVEGALKTLKDELQGIEVDKLLPEKLEVELPSISPSFEWQHWLAEIIKKVENNILDLEKLRIEVDFKEVFKHVHTGFLRKILPFASPVSIDERADGVLEEVISHFQEAQGEIASKIEKIISSEGIQQSLREVVEEITRQKAEEFWQNVVSFINSVRQPIEDVLKALELSVEERQKVKKLLEEFEKHIEGFTTRWNQISKLYQVKR